MRGFAEYTISFSQQFNNSNNIGVHVLDIWHQNYFEIAFFLHVKAKILPDIRDVDMGVII